MECEPLFEYLPENDPDTELAVEMVIKKLRPNSSKHIKV